MIKSRIKYIDTVKGIGILLVVIGHHLRIVSVFDWIYSFHMPLFFIVSGYVYVPKDNDFKDFVRRKARTLLWPYFTFSIISILWSLFVKYVLHGEVDLFNNVVLSLSTYGNGPIWFLTSLFWAVILFEVGIRWNKIVQFSVILSIIGIIISVFLKGYSELYLPVQYALRYVGRAFIGESFLAIGFYLNRLVVKSSKILELSMIGILGAISLLAFRFNSVDLVRCMIGNPFLYYLLALSGSLFLILVYKNTRIQDSVILNFLGKNSLTIMAIHTLYPIEIAYLIIGVSGLYRLGWEAFISGVAILLELPVEIISIMLINRYFPYIIRWDGRGQKEM